MFCRGTDDDTALGWCYLAGNGTDGEFWVIFTYYLVLFCNLVATSYFTIRIYIKYRQLAMGNNYPEVQGVVESLKLYPMAMLLNWGPNFIFSIVINFGLVPSTSQNALLFNLVLIIATQNSTLAAIIFFNKSNEARRHWVNLFRHMCYGESLEKDFEDDWKVGITPSKVFCEDVDNSRDESESGHYTRFSDLSSRDSDIEPRPSSFNFRLSAMGIAAERGGIGLTSLDGATTFNSALNHW